MSQSPDRTAADRPVPKPGILDISAYVPGKAKVDGIAHPLKLSSNENILGCSPQAKAAYVAAIDQLHIYPDSRATPLRQAIAAEFRLEPEQLIFGCGSDEIFHMLCQVYLEPGDNIVQGQYAFGAYAIGARACQAEVLSAPEPDYRVDVDGLLELVNDRTRLVFIANPGNPTGTYVGGEEIRRLHAALPKSVVLVLDGAYAEFVEGDYEDGLALARWMRDTHPRTGLVMLTTAGEAVDRIVGLELGADDYIPKPFELREVLREPLFVPATRAAERVLDDLRRTRAHLAVVLDEYGGTAGIVTMEDLVEEVVGDIADEYDPLSRDALLFDGVLELAGSMSLVDVRSDHKLPIPEGDWSTLGGYAFAALGRLPRVGDRVTYPGGELEVVAMDGRRVAALRVHRRADLVPVET